MQQVPRNIELWSEREWRCEWWTVDGRPQVRLYFGGHLVNALTDGPNLDLRRQTELWHSAVDADRHRS